MQTKIRSVAPRTRSGSYGQPVWRDGGAAAETVAKPDVEHAQRFEQPRCVQAAGLFTGKPRLRTARVHSHYVRTVSDLPRCERRVELRVVALRFICLASYCHQKIFAERFGRYACSVGTPHARAKVRYQCPPILPKPAHGLYSRADRSRHEDGAGSADG